MAIKTQIVTRCDHCNKEHVQDAHRYEDRRPEFIEVKMCDKYGNFVPTKHFCRKKCLQSWLEDTDGQNS